MFYFEESLDVKEKYRVKFVTADEAVKFIKSNDRVYIHSGCAFPEGLVEALARRKDELFNVEVCHLMGVGEAAYTRPEMAGHFRHNAFFIGQNSREAIKEGRADFTPIFLSEIPTILRKYPRHRINVALIQVSPPDKRGFCSFGVGVDITKTAAGASERKVAEATTRQEKRGYVVGVLGARGGLGTTSVAVNLAASLYARIHTDILLAELLPGQGALALDLGVDGIRGLTELLSITKLNEITHDRVNETLVGHPSGLKLFLSSDRPRDMHLINQLVNYETIVKRLAGLGRFLTLDMGVGMQPFAEKILPLCNEVIIVIEGNPNTIIHAKALIRHWGPWHSEELYPCSAQQPRPFGYTTADQPGAGQAGARDHFHADPGA